MIHRSLIAVLLALLLTRCGDEEASEPPDLPTDGVLLEYSRAGGLAFSIYEVRIDADGSGTVATGSDLDQLDRQSFELDDAELAELTDVLAANPISDFPKAANEDCPDAFGYTFAYGGEEYTYNGCDEDPEGATAVRSTLARLPVPPDDPVGG